MAKYMEWGLFLSCGQQAPNWCNAHHKFSGYTLAGDVWLLSAWVRVT